jgi:hypothetical protein
MNNQNQPTQLSDLDYLLHNNEALQQYYVDSLYSKLKPEINTLFLDWLKQHPDLFIEFKELRSTKDLLQTNEKPMAYGMILPSFYQEKNTPQIWSKKLYPILKWAAIIALFFTVAKLLDVQIEWNENALTFQFGEKFENSTTLNEEDVSNVVFRELSSQLPVINSVIESLIKDELGQAMLAQNQHYEQLLINNIKDQELIYQNLIHQISEEISIQRRSDLLQIMQELDETRAFSSTEIAKNREVINGLIQYAGVTTADQTRTINEE